MTETKGGETHAGRTRDSFAKIPPEKKKAMRVRTVFGLALAVIGVCAGNNLLFKGLNVNYSLAIFGAGFLIASLQYISQPLKVGAAAVADYMNAIRKGERPPNGSSYGNGHSAERELPERETRGE